MRLVIVPPRRVQVESAWGAAFFAYNAAHALAARGAERGRDGRYNAG